MTNIKQKLTNAMIQNKRNDNKSVTYAIMENTYSPRMGVQTSVATKEIIVEVGHE